MKKVLSIAIVALILAALCIPVISSAATKSALLFDEAGLLDESDNTEIKNLLVEVSNKHGVDVAIVTVQDFAETFKTNTIREADEYFCKESGYVSTDCVTLMISMSERDWYIYSNDKAHEAFDSWGLEYIGDQINEDLHDGDYDDAFAKYADLADEFLVAYEKGTPYSSSHKKMSLTDYLIRFGVPIGAGLLIGLIAVFSVKKKYKPVQLKAEANDYLIQGSLQVHNAYDHFIYTHVSRTRKAKSSSSNSFDSGSSSGAGGKF